MGEVCCVILDHIPQKIELIHFQKLMRKHIDRLKKETTSYYNLQLKKTCGKWTWKHLLCIWQLVSSNCLAFFTEDFMKRNLLVVFVVIPISRGRSIEALCIIINALWTDHATKRSRVLSFFPFHLSNWIVLETNFFQTSSGSSHLMTLWCVSWWIKHLQMLSMS